MDRTLHDADGDWISIKRWGGYRPPVLLFGLGGGLAALVLSQLLVDPEPPAIQAFEIGVPLLLVLPVFYTAQSVRDSDRASARQSRILLMSLLFAVIATGTVTIIFVSAFAEGTRFRELFFPLLASSAAGAGVGSLAGINYDEVRATREALEAEVDRKRRLNQRLTVINRVLRHNVRNTLTLALGLLDEVVEQVTDPTVVDRLRRCRKALESLHSSAENALHVESLWSRETDPVLVELGPILQTAVEHARDLAPAATIELSMSDPARVRVHPLLPVALREAVENAVSHNDPDDLTVEISVVRSSELVTVAVADDGCGIPASEVESLELDEETPLKHTSGVGLWVVKWVTEASGGTVWIGSNEADGTTVELRLPRE